MSRNSHADESDESYESDEDTETPQSDAYSGESEESEHNNRMSIDEGQCQEEDELPTAIIYLKSDENLSFRNDPRLFDVLNDRIHDNNCNDIDGYLQKHSDYRIDKEHFDSNKCGMEDVQHIQSLYLRKKAMNCIMNKIDENIQHIIENADRSIFNDIVNFAQNAYSSNNNSNNQTSMQYLWTLNEYVLPTAMLMCGQNVSDHPLHFGHLQNELETNVSPLIVRFKQTDLKQNGSFGSKTYDVEKFIIDTIFQKLTDWKVTKSNPKKYNQTKIRTTRVTELYKKDISDDMEYFDMKRLLKLPPINSIKNEIIRTFLLWYFRFGKNVNKYWRKNNCIKSCFDELPKIIIMIDGIEQWSPNTLSSLIYILHDMAGNYKNIASNLNIPFLLVLGVSTSEDLIQQMIGADALRLLSVNRFYFEPSNKLYSRLAQEILIESSPILFDETILNKLLHHSQLNDFSVNRFKDQIKYLFMSYFMNTKASQYAAYLMYLKDKQVAIGEGDDDNKQFDLWWFAGEVDYIADILQNTEEVHDGRIDEEFKDYIEKVFITYCRYVDALRVFKMVLDHLGFEWSLSEIIAKLQDKQLLFKHLLARVGAVDNNIFIPSEKGEREEFPERIEDFKDCHQIYTILEEKTKSFDKDIAANAAKQYKIITNGLEEKTNIDTHTNTNNNGNNKRKRKLNTKQKRTALKKQLTANTNKILYGEGRKNLFELLRLFIEKHLKPMNELPLNEIFVYSAETEFCADMFPPTNRQFRKRYENINKSESDIKAEAMCCIYDVYQETDGLYINLHDAYIAFKERFSFYNINKMDIDHNIPKKRRKKKRNKKQCSKEEMSTDEEKENEKEKVSEKEKRNQIQFRLSIEDLRFCGFLKATNRKKEALMKMADLL